MVDQTRLSRNRFLVLGRAGMDFYADPPGTPLEEARAFFPALGGSAANIATAIAQLGGHAALITRVSDDAVGRYVVTQLQNYGVVTDYVWASGGGARTSLAVVETRAENCQSVLYRHNASDFELTRDDVASIRFDEAGALIVTGTALAMEPSRSATFEAMARARTTALPVIIDVDYRPYSWQSRHAAAEICGRAVAMSDIVIGNDEEFAVLAHDKDGLAFAKALSQQSASIVIYKQGEKGSITFAAQDSFALGIYRVAALKPTGAGDAFMGGFVTGLAYGLSLHDSVQRGSAAAALVVTRVGCSPANPTPEDLDHFIATHVMS